MNDDMNKNGFQSAPPFAAQDPVLSAWDEEPKEAAPPALKLGQILVGVFASPGKMYESIRTKPHIWGPLLVGAVITLLSVLPTQSLLESYTRQVLESQMASTGQAYPPELIEKQIKSGYMMALIFSPFAVVITPLIKGLICHGMTQIFGGKGTIKQSISIIAIAYMVIILGEVIRAPLSIATNTMLTFSPAMLLPADQMGKPLHSLLSMLDIFTLWYLGVAAVGFKVVHRLSSAKAVAVSVVPFAVLMLMQGGMVAISMMMMGAK